jgi:hypothetical protein
MMRARGGTWEGKPEWAGHLEMEMEMWKEGYHGWALESKGSYTT